MVVHVFVFLVYMVFQGSFMVFNGKLMSFHGSFVGFHGSLLVFKVFKVTSWFVMVFGLFSS